MFNGKIFHRKQVRELIGKAGGVEEACKVMEMRFALKSTDPKHWDPMNFDMLEIAEALGGETSRVAHNSSIPMFSEAVTAAQFQTLVGTLLSTLIMQAYDKETMIVDQLATTFPSSLESDKVPGAFINGGLEDVNENQPYPQLGDIIEKYVTIDHQKRGLMMNVTEESVRFDRSGLVMREAVKLGERMRFDREDRFIKAILDRTGFKSWRPTGTQADLFQNAQADSIHDYDNLTTDVLANYTDVEALWLLMRLMKDDNGEPIVSEPKILLVPVTLEVIANRIIMNEVLAGASNAERNPFANKFQILSTSLLDAQSTIEWYLGDFKKQFVIKQIIPMEVQTRPNTAAHQDGWNRDILAQYKVRYDETLAATDYRFVGKSAGTG